MRSFWLKLTSVCLIFVLAFGLAGCKNGGEAVVDQLFEMDMDDQTIFLFRYDDRYIDTEHFYEVDVGGFDISCEDGGFVKVDCDVTYLSGGEAGYNHCPVLRTVREVTPVTLEQTIPPGGSLPQVATRTFGFSAIGSYADADYCLWSYGTKGVLKDGKWLYKYDDTFYTDDGATVMCREDADRDEISKKIGEGVVLCEDFFVMPVKGE